MLYGAEEQAQDFARENARFDTAYKERVAQVIARNGPGFSVDDWQGSTDRGDGVYRPGIDDPEFVNTANGAVPNRMVADWGRPKAYGAANGNGDASPLNASPLYLDASEIDRESYLLTQRMAAREAQIARDLADPLSLGVNDRYRDAITLASDRTGYPRATIAAVISAEAAPLSGQRLIDATNQRFYDELHPELRELPFVFDKELAREWKQTRNELSRMWDPESFNAQSGAGGLTQFVETTWADDIARRNGSYLNQQAKALGFIDAKNKILDRAGLLDLRYDPTLSIVSAAELDKGYYTQLAARTKSDGTSLLPANMMADEQAKYIYLAHHEGAGGAAVILNDQLDDKGGLRLLKNHVPNETTRQSMIDANGGSAAKAYTNYLWQYINQRIVPGRFR